MNFSEFEAKLNELLFVSATPGPYEAEHATNVEEQIIRPTGLVDPKVEIRPVRGQMDDIISEIHRVNAKGQKTLITTLTKKMAEDLTQYLTEAGIRVRYLHSDIDTLERLEIVHDLRSNVYDVLVGINLLREGLDIPEVSFIAILDADKEGFLRSETALIQTIGRAARNVDGHVILYADTVTGSMERALQETDRRRSIQEAYNKEHGITPKSIQKEIRSVIRATEKLEEEPAEDTMAMAESMSREALLREIAEREKAMQLAALDLRFEEAARLRDEMKELKRIMEENEA